VMKSLAEAIEKLQGDNYVTYSMVHARIRLLLDQNRAATNSYVAAAAARGSEFQLSLRKALHDAVKLRCVTATKDGGKNGVPERNALPRYLCAFLDPRFRIEVVAPTLRDNEVAFYESHLIRLMEAELEDIRRKSDEDMMPVDEALTDPRLEARKRMMAGRELTEENKKKVQKVENEWGKDRAAVEKDLLLKKQEREANPLVNPDEPRDPLKRAYSARDEMALYKVKSGHLPLTDDVLVWWAANAAEYPLLSRLARRYLALPATSASSERVFSHAKLIITALRNALSPDHAAKLLYISRNVPVLRELGYLK
jgi:hypothetical protein